MLAQFVIPALGQQERFSKVQELRYQGATTIGLR